MLTQLALLPLLAVTVTGVTSETNDSDVVVEVATSEPVPARVARPMVGPHLLYVFVDGATPAEAVFKNGARPIVARTRSRYTKLEVPLDPGVRCREPATVETLPSGLRVEFSCSSNPGAVATAEDQVRPLVEAHRTIKAGGRSASQELLQAALALPTEMPFAAKTEPGEDENQASQTLAADKPSVKTAAPPAEETKVVAPAAAGAEPVHSEKGVGPEVKQAGIAPTTAASAAVPMAASSPVAPAESLSAPIATAAKAGRSGAPLVVAIITLLGVAGGALALTRRRARRQGLIHILETAAIGPKRALLVARVNGRTMVLGASEAGIALLASLDGTIEPPVAAVMGNLPAVRDQSHEPAPAPVDTVTDEPEGEMGVLSRLFRRRPKDSSAQDTAAFRELLEESYEDQELRDKLAQGLSGKVS